jgi:hypothetical protein
MDQLTVPKTPGARRAGPGEYLFELAQIDRFKVGADYSTTPASCIEGDRMMLASARMAAGTGADAHSHPNEQWFLLEGTLVGRRRRAIRGKVGRLGLHPGEYSPFRQGNERCRRSFSDGEGQFAQPARHQGCVAH